jgi:hypothetical protein
MSDMIRIPKYWTDFESENGFEKVLQLATKLIQVVIDQNYSLTPQGPIRTKSPSPENRAWTNYWTDFQSENGFQKLLQLATKVVQVLIEQCYSLKGQYAQSPPSPDTVIEIREPATVAPSRSKLTN